MSSGVQYRERLSPSLWALVAAAVCGPMVALALSPIDTTLALVLGAVVAVAVVAALVAVSPVVSVSEGRLSAGRATIEVGCLGRPIALIGEDARAARGPRLDPRSWMLIRGGLPGLVVIPVEDERDPTPSWVVSSRTPERLAAAIERARVSCTPCR